MDIDNLVKVGALMELISKCREMVQMDQLVGGARGYVDETLKDAENAVYEKLERMKEEIG